jgi:hypothetical protein
MAICQSQLNLLGLSWAAEIDEGMNRPRFGVPELKGDPRLKRRITSAFT